MRAVNLLPSEHYGERSRPQAPVLVGVIGAVVVTGLVCAGFLMKSGEVTQQTEALRLAEAELASVPPPPVVEDAQPQLKEVRDARLIAVSAALGRRVTWDGVLRRFSQVLPEDVWLSTLSVQSPVSGPSGAPAIGTGSAAIAGAGGSFILSGYSYSHDAVARLLARLGVVPDLVGVQLQRSEQTKLDGRDVVTFSIQASLRNPEPAA
jgi:Tfp pilus assembly protein PilN